MNKKLSNFFNVLGVVLTIVGGIIGISIAFENRFIGISIISFCFLITVIIIAKNWFRKNIKPIIVSIIIISIVSIVVINGKELLSIAQKINDEDKKKTSNENKKINIGSYVEFGKYYNEPIVWECMKEDENGFLLVSKDIICLKAFDSAESGTYKEGDTEIERFGSNIWGNSNIREWLNSNENNVKYTTKPPTKKAVWEGYNAYADEAGFLTNLNSENLNRINIFKHDGIEDKVFLLSKEDIELLWKNKEDRTKCLTKNAVESSDYKSDYIKENGKYRYWTRSPSSDASYYAYFVDSDGSLSKLFYFYYKTEYFGCSGVVPALYLKSNIYKSGEGSIENPYKVF